MTGDPNKLTSRCCALYPRGPRRDILDSVLTFLLASQIVTSEYYDYRLWVVVEGSSMGRMHSQFVSNATFFSSAEKDFLDRELLSACHIRYYSRFQDDLMFVADCRKSFRSL